MPPRARGRRMPVVCFLQAMARYQRNVRERSRLAPSRSTMRTALVDAEPDPIAIDSEATALVIIDMQRDFLEPGGFGETLGNDVSLLQAAVAPLRKVLDAARAAKMLIIHTRERPRPDLSGALRHKVERGEPSLRIGSPGPMGRILVRGEPGHDIIPELYPIAGSDGIGFAGKGAFYPSNLELVCK